MNNQTKQITTFLLAFSMFSVFAKENVYNPGKSKVVYTKVAAGCDPSNSQTDLDVNNVRTTIMGGGDMWWNLDDARYEIPKNGNRHSMFAGALWIGGVDAGGQLKVAAMTYRQDGNDFWPGPLNTTTATIEAEECVEWDKHFKIERSDIEEHVARVNVDPTYVPSQAILDWPAHGDLTQGQAKYLAPFFDVNGNGEYEPYDGDYPDYNITGTNDDARLYGDQTLWWIFNDKGNIHSETGAQPLGLEIHAQAFGFTAEQSLAAGARMAQLSALVGEAATATATELGQQFALISGMGTEEAMQRMINLQQQTGFMYGDLTNKQFRLLSAENQRNTVMSNTLETLDQLNDCFNLLTRNFKSSLFKIVGDPPPKNTVPTFNLISFSFNN